MRPSFWKAYDSLDTRVKEAARRSYRLFDENPSHPSLHFKKLAGYDTIWSVRVNQSVRAICERDGIL